MSINKHLFNEAEFNKYKDTLRSQDFLAYIQRRIDYNISEIKQQYFNYIEEAEFGVKLLSKFDLQDKRILEIGSGAGILTCWMLKNDVDIVGIEPSAIGFTFHNDIYTAILDYFSLPPNRIYDLTAEELDVNITGTFDLIFSVNVMEHIPTENLELAFSKMNSVLKAGGSMYHHCPNYIVPFEPHYGIPLIPFFPQVTGKMKKVHEEGLWKSINFITLPQVNQIATKLGLKADFQKGMMADAFIRLDHDAEYAKRHPLLVKMNRVFKKTGVIFLLKNIPPSLCTPMTFTLTKKS
jgi:SAM-dependent methyltransferase